jgi:hypothetical protein
MHQTCDQAAAAKMPDHRLGPIIEPTFERKWFVIGQTNRIPSTKPPTRRPQVLAHYHELQPGKL